MTFHFRKRLLASCCLRVIFVFSLSGCTDSRLPLTENGLPEYIYRVAGVGFEYEYQIEEYKKWTRKEKGVGSKGVNELFVLRLSEVDHKRIIESDLEALGWKKVIVKTKPRTHEPISFGYTKTVIFDVELMNCTSFLSEDEPRVKISFAEKPFSYYAN